MKVLALLPTYRPISSGEPVGGGEISNRLLLAGLVERGHEVTVAAIKGGQEPCSTSDGVTVYSCYRRRFGKMLDQLAARRTYPRLAATTVRVARPDIILTATSALPVALRVARHAPVPVGVFVRAHEHFPQPPRTAQDHLQAVARRIIIGDMSAAILRKADFLLPNSQFMKRECERMGARMAMHVVYPPLDVKVAPSRNPGEIRRVSMVGTHAKKGTQTVELLARHFPDIHFRIVGSPPQAGVVAAGNLTRIGWTDIGQEFRDEADLVLVPSIWNEPFGRVAIEALAAGALVLVSDRGGLPEAVANQSALLVPATDPAAWEQQLRHAITAPAGYRVACDVARDGLAAYALGAQLDELERALFLEWSRHSR